MDKTIRVGVAISDDVYRRRLSKAIEAEAELNLICLCASIDDLVSHSTNLAPEFAHVLILGLEMQDTVHWLKIEEIVTKFPLLELIVLSNSQKSELILKSLKMGAHSFMSDETPVKNVVNTIYTVLNGGAVMSSKATRNLMDFLSAQPKHELLGQLTKRQMDIIEGISDGLSYKMIAEKYDISIDTVRSHIKNIYKILNVHNKIEVINMYRSYK